MAKNNKFPLSQRAVEMVAARFKVLSEPLRIQILQTLYDRRASVGEITETVRSTQPNVSKHLKILQDAGLVARQPEGNTVFYSIADASVFELCDVVCSSLKEDLAERQAMFS